jgi:hypothetical protein
LPLLGLDIDLEQASFAPHNTAEAAKRWAAETCIIATNTSIEEVVQARIRQATKTATVTLIVDPIRGPRGCVVNVAHTFLSLTIYDVVHEFITQLSHPDSERGIDAIFSPDFLLDITPRLPQSLCHAYWRTHQPTPKDLKTAMAVIQRAQARYARSTIGIPIHKDWKTRPSHMHNKTIAFEPAESRAAFKIIKQLGVTPTSVFLACMTSATAQMYSAGNEEGAHLLFSGNGRRWIDTSGDGHGPVTMSIIPGGLWVDASEGVDFRATDKEGLATLAKAIGRAQEEDLISPHVIALYDQMAPELVKAMAEPFEAPAVARPTLTSQGPFSTRPLEVVDPIRMMDFNTGGRSTDPGVCFALNSFKDELKFNLLFDERFFVLDEIVKLGIDVAGLFRTFVGEGELVRAKI